ncbi:GTP 3',8-cyclase MoaA [Mycobacterium simiae]|uniref:GTP 3',8-cyclase n=1 Tax=Mycobacterium simiae TaxID=1784 RepID=A0A5B1BXA8_MYCSI|nr:GTP 3',8-cyclase MoaA [Mycobacterium simiae]KAA1251809.1 GTP 3',8-cyclase MoaA [Mycobacterium simiae]
MTVISLGTPRITVRPSYDRPESRYLVDRFGRRAVDLRVSLTDRCNLRCSYCMPAGGLDWMADFDRLTDDEVVRLVAIAVAQLGIREVRFTGGEPLLRRGLESIVARVARLRPRPRISLTSNGIGLTRRAAPLAAAGVDRVNVSLDTLRPDRYQRITRRDRLRDVLAGLAAAKDAGLGPVKINSVLLRGVNHDEATSLLGFALAHDYELRFIEQMPLDAQHGWDRGTMVEAEEILSSLQAEFELTADREERGPAPAELWLVNGGPGKVGVIASVTKPFCAGCDRTRLTADGQLRSCLFSSAETDLRSMLRTGATDSDIAQCWRDAMWAKAPGHAINTRGFLQPSRPMSAIGG